MFPNAGHTIALQMLLQYQELFFFDVIKQTDGWQNRVIQRKRMFYLSFAE